MSFKAPWSRSLAWMTGLILAILVGSSWMGVRALPASMPVAKFFTVLVPFVIAVATSAFMVRGYAVKDGTLFIQRLGWSTRFDLAHLKTVTIDPEAMKGSIRLLGVGGLFAFSGLYHSRALGRFHLYATDPSRSVVLRLGDKTVVVTPDAPEHFVQQLKTVR